MKKTTVILIAFSVVAAMAMAMKVAGSFAGGSGQPAPLRFLACDEPPPPPGGGE